MTSPENDPPIISAVPHPITDLDINTVDSGFY